MTGHGAFKRRSGGRVVECGVRGSQHVGQISQRLELDGVVGRIRRRLGLDGVIGRIGRRISQRLGLNFRIGRCNGALEHECFVTLFVYTAIALASHHNGKRWRWRQDVKEGCRWLGSDGVVGRITRRLVLDGVVGRIRRWLGLDGVVGRIRRRCLGSMGSLGRSDGGLGSMGLLGASGGGGSGSGLGSAVGSVVAMGRMSMNVLLLCSYTLLVLSHPTTTVDAGGGVKS